MRCFRFSEEARKQSGASAGAVYPISGSTPAGQHLVSVGSFLPQQGGKSLAFPKRQVPIQ